MVVCKLFEFGSLKFVLWERVKKGQNLQHYQFESICRSQNKIYCLWNVVICFIFEMKTLWEKNKMLVTSIFSFLHNLLTLSQTQILDSCKLKDFADDNFKFDENGRKFSKWIENTGKRRNCSL